MRSTNIVLYRSLLLLTAVICMGGPLTARVCGQCAAALTHFSGGSGFNAAVEVVADFDPDGDGPEPAALFVGGSFTSVDDLAVRYIARWDGSNWSDVGGGMNGPVQALTVFDDDGEGPNLPQLYTGGSFTTAGRVAASRVARWNGVEWSPVGRGMDGRVNALAVYDDDAEGPRLAMLHAGGAFRSADGVWVGHVARWDGAVWSALGTGVEGRVHTMTAYDDGGPGPNRPVLVLGGAIRKAGAVPARSIARWDGSAWSAIGDGFNGAVLATVVHDPDGPGPYPAELHAGGRFDASGRTAVPRIARWTGATWVPLAAGLNADVFSLASFDPDGAGPLRSNLYVGGAFTSAGGQGLSSLAQWDGLNWSAVGTGMSGPVHALHAFDEDGEGPNVAALFVGGNVRSTTGIAGMGRVDMLPRFVAPPSLQPLSPAGEASLAVTAAGPGTLRYQWYKGQQSLQDGGHVWGATSPAPTFSPANPADAGEYQVVVSNENGSIISAPVTMLVGPRDWAISNIRIVIPRQVTLADGAPDTRGKYHPEDTLDPQIKRTMESPAFVNYVYTPGDTLYVTGNVAPVSTRPHLILGKTAPDRVQLGSMLSTLHLSFIEGKLQRQLSAEMLQSYLQQSLPTNIQVTIGTTTEAGSINVHLGPSTYTAGKIDFNLPTPIDRDGYILKRIDDSNFIIAGPTEDGTENGVYEFLEQFFEVRWLIPDNAFTTADLASILPAAGEPNYVPDSLTVRGDYVVRFSTRPVDLTEQRHTPAYLTRWSSGFGFSSNGLVSTHNKWLRRLRAHWRVESGHNITNLFPASKYAVSKPDLYPMYRPGHEGDATYPLEPYPNVTGTSWNPNFSASDLASVGAAEVDAFFNNNPQATSISLTLMDGVVNDDRDASYQREPAAAKPPNLKSKNSIGWRDLSWTVLTWANALSAQLENSDKYLAVLAYHETYDPPSVAPRSGAAAFGPANRLAPNIVVFTCFERLRLLDWGQLAFYQDWVSRWQQVISGELGAHDYLHHSVTPVLPLSHMQHYLAADAVHIRHSRSEASVNYGDALRYYAHFKLLWDPNIDVMGPRGMMQDWCSKLVGPAAAPSLITYHQLWDNFWSMSPNGARTLKTLTGATGSFATYHMSEQLDRDDVVSMLETSRTLLNACVSNAMADPAATPDQRNRAKVLRAQFEYWNMTGRARLAASKAHTMQLLTAGVPDPARVTDATQTLLSGIAANQGRFNFCRNHPQNNNYGNSHILGVTDGVPRLNSDFDSQGKRWSEDLMFRLLPYRDHAVVGPGIRTAINNVNAIPALNPHMNTELSKLKAAWLRMANFPPAAVNQNYDPGFSTTTLSGAGGDNWRRAYSSAPFTVAPDPVTGLGKVVRIAGPTAPDAQYQSYPALSSAISIPLNGGQVASGDHLALLKVYTPVGHEGPGYLTFYSLFIKANASGNDQVITGTRAKRIFTVPGEWVTVPHFFTVSPTLGATKISLLLFANGLGDNQQIYVDDYLVYKVPEAAPLLGAIVRGAGSVTVSSINTDAQKVSILINDVEVASVSPAVLTAPCCLPPPATLTSVTIQLPSGQTFQAGQKIVARMVPSDFPSRNWDSLPVTVP